MDPQWWAWFGLVIGVSVTVGAFVVVRRRPSAPLASLLPGLGAVTLIGAGSAAVGALLVDGWWPWGVVGIAVGAVIGWLAGATGMGLIGVAEFRTPDDAPGACSLAAVAGFGIAAAGVTVASLGYLGSEHWPTDGTVAPALCLGVAIGGLVARVSDPGATLSKRGFHSGPVADLMVLGAVAPMAAALVAAGISNLPGAARAYPLAVALVGVVAAMLVSRVFPATGATDVVTTLHRRRYVASAAVGVGGFATAALTFDEPALILGFGACTALGSALCVVFGWIGGLATSDHWRPVKRIAARSKAGAAAVILTGVAEAGKAGMLLIGAGIAGFVAAAAIGDIALGGGGAYGVSLTVVALAATVATAGDGVVFAALVRASGELGDAASASRREAAEATAAAGSAAGAASGVVVLGTGLAVVLALLLGFRSAVVGTIDLSQSRVMLGLIGGATVSLLGVGWGVHRTAAGPRPAAGRAWAAVGGMGLAVALPVVAGTFDPAVLDAVLVGGLVTGAGFAFSAMIAAGSWENARRLIETGAYGGPGSRAHRALVAADTVGEPFREFAAPAVVSVLMVMAATAVAFSGGFG